MKNILLIVAIIPLLALSFIAGWKMHENKDPLNILNPEVTQANPLGI